MSKFLTWFIFLVGAVALPYNLPVGLLLLAIAAVMLLHLWQGRSSASGRDSVNDPNYAPEKIVASEQPESRPESQPDSLSGSLSGSLSEGQTPDAASASEPLAQQEVAQAEDEDPSSKRVEAQQRYKEALESHSKHSAVLNFWKWLLIISGVVMLFVFWPVGLGLLVVSFFVAGARWGTQEKMVASASASLMESLRDAAENAEKNGLEPATANQVWRIGKLARETNTWEIDTRSDALGRPLLCIERASDIIEELQMEKLHQAEEELWS